jgi:hypothetical protein
VELFCALDGRAGSEPWRLTWPSSEPIPSQDYIDRFYIPGLRKAGGFRAAAVVDTEGRLFLHDAGPGFPADWVNGSAQAGGAAAVEVRTAKANEAELLAWAAPQPSGGGKRPAGTRTDH